MNLNSKPWNLFNIYLWTDFTKILIAIILYMYHQIRHISMKICEFSHSVLSIDNYPFRFDDGQIVTFTLFV